jgi:hypothetical protein
VVLTHGLILRDPAKPLKWSKSAMVFAGSAKGLETAGSR